MLSTAAVFGSGARGSTTKLWAHGNSFFSNCRFSHTSSDDPIVYPGQPGRSHRHTFFGNRSTNASSTLASLRKAATTCTPRADTAAYWVPTLFQAGREIRPAKTQIYYILLGYEEMHPFPAGLRMVAGDAHAVSPQSTRVTFWTCGGRAASTAPSRTVPAICPVLEGQGFTARRGKSGPTTVPLRTKTSLQVHVDFRDCWDGKHLDAPDHQSHMTYSRAYVCPRSHPVKVPRIRLRIRYRSDRGAGVTLASGGQLSGHADFINAWDQKELERLVDECFGDRPCDRR